MASSLTHMQVVEFFRDAENASSRFTPKDWELLLRQARRTNLLCRTAFLVDKKNLIDRVPEQLRYHLEGSTMTADSNLRSVRWEVSKIYEALEQIKSPLVLLKGAAYVLQNCDAANGRLFSDVDIMVKKDRLEDSERNLYQNGWISTKIDAYDQKYYREWMHELPPMRNLKRRSELDVHHTIIPPTAHLKTDIQKIWDRVEPIPGYPGMFALSSIDMILHSAAHLFHEGEFDQGLRDLVDLDALLKEQAGKDPSFWEKLPERAQELNLSRPLYYGLRYCRKLLATPIPEDCYRKVSTLGAPIHLYRYVMDKMLLKAMTPSCIHHPNNFAGLSKFILFVRSHYLRMPLTLLIPHLIRKSLRPE